MVPQNSLVLKQSARVVIQENSVKLMASTKHLGTVLQDTSAEKMHLLVNLQMASLVSTLLVTCFSLVCKLTFQRKQNVLRKQRSSR